jgi:Spy/CpxP family protein refolding chaperone
MNAQRSIVPAAHFDKPLSSACFRRSNDARDCGRILAIAGALATAVEAGQPQALWREDSMRLKIFSLFAASLLIFAGSVAAQTPAENDPPQTQAAASQEQARTPNFGARRGQIMRPGEKGRVIMGPGRPMRKVEEHGPGWAGPLSMFSKMEAQLDNPMVRAALGLTDQQADSLRKILVNTEVFTIQTGAGAMVDGIQLKELLREDNPDRAAVMAKGDAISKSVSDLVDHYLDAILSAKKILTPQQQKIIREYMENGGHGFGASRRPMSMQP